MRLTRLQPKHLVGRLLTGEHRDVSAGLDGERQWIAGPPSDGEIYYLWLFLLWGSIMEPDVRWRLRHAWGFCERHSWAFLSVESAFRPSFPYTSALLYEDLMERARHAFGLTGPLRARRLRHALREQGPCIMCEMHYGPASRAVAPGGVLERGRDVSPLLTFAEATKAWWSPAVCGVCSGAGEPARCRRHLRDELRGRTAYQIEDSKRLVQAATEHIARYARSFRWESRGTDSDEDRAARISIAGWCAGWRPLLELLR